MQVYEYIRHYVKQLTNRRGTSWQGVIVYKDPATERQRTKTKVFDRASVRTRAQARAALGEWMRELEDEEKRPRSPLLQEYLDSYISNLADTKAIEVSTATGYRLSAKHIYREFAGKRLDELTPAGIQEWEGRLMREGKSSATVGRAHRLLKQVLKHAVNAGELARNPANPVKPPARKAPEPNSLDAQGRAKALAMLDASMLTPVVTASYIALFTGMRQGEICALKWRDVDLDHAEIRVRRSIGKGEGGCYVKTPKTGGSNRVIPLPSRLLSVLERRLADMVRDMPSGADADGLYVCGGVDGSFLNPTVLGRSWATMAKNADLVGTEGRRCTFHDLRHTYATVAISGGADVKSVASILGHANAAMTLNVYASADADAKRRAAEIVARGLCEPVKAPHTPRHLAESRTLS